MEEGEEEEGGVEGWREEEEERERDLRHDRWCL